MRRFKRMCILFLGLGLGLGLALAACAFPAPTGPVSTVAMPAGLTLHLPKPAALGRTIDAAQSVILTYPGGTVAFEGRIRSSPERVYLVCIDPLGRRALSAEWTDQGARFETAPWLPGLLRPANVLADLIVIYAPQTTVAEALPGAEVVTDAAGRTVRRKGEDILHVDYAPGGGDDIWSGTAVYRNIPWHYTLTVQSAEVTP
jgi:hypothetical protein